MTSASFDGFSLPEGAWLPPELVYLLPSLKGSQVMILVVLLYNQLQIGGEEPTSLTDLQHLTGLSRQTVITSLDPLMGSGMVERIPIGQSFAYRVLVKFLDHKLSKLKLSSRESDSKTLLTDSLNLDSPKIVQLVKKLRAAGVFLKTAQAMISQHSPEKIEQHLDYYEYALGRGMAQGPGWLVLSVKEDWGAPLGYHKNGRRKYDTETGNDDWRMFQEKETQACPMCGMHVEKLIRVDGYLYAKPCGCKLYYGVVPLSWKEHADD